MSKKKSSTIKLHIKANQANPAPPIGPALGQRGVNIMSFCKEFNNKTKNLPSGSVLPVIINIYNDRSFDFIIKKPTTSYLLKNALNIESGSSDSSKKKAGILSLNQIKNIASIKSDDLSSYTIESAMKTIIGTAKSMGIDVEQGVIDND